MSHYNWTVRTCFVSMETQINFPNLRGSVIDKIRHKNDTFQCIMPYDTPNGRSLRVVCHHFDLECVLISWLPWQQISHKNLPKI